LIHPESHFTDEKAGMLRRATYRRLRRHWQFMNALMLFEVHDQVSYGIHVYSGPQQPHFEQATSLYHPSTVERSLEHDGSGAEPGLKDDEGRWDVRPHASRIQRVDEGTLTTWHAVLEDETVPVQQTRMVYTVNRATAAVLAKLASAPRIGSLGLQFSRGWDESIDRKKGRFDSEWGVPESWDSVILQGPHIHVGTPFYKSPNPTMLHNQDWTAVDLEALPPDAIPATQYKPRGDRAVYDAAYTHWETPNGRVSARSQFRVAWRTMAAVTGERTLIPTIVPPGAAHVDVVFTVAAPRAPEVLALVAGFASSLLSDMLIRTSGKKHIRVPQFESLPFVEDNCYAHAIVERVLRLNATTAAFTDLWEEVMTPPWNTAAPIRLAQERRKALIEIDVLVALSLGITVDEIATVYRTQFPVLYGYDHDEYLYDRNGRIVPTGVRQAWRKAGSPSTEDGLDAATRTSRHPGSGVEYLYELPFSVLDREADLRAAYAELERRYAKEA